MVQRDQGLWLHQLDVGSADAFIRVSAVERAGPPPRTEGQKLSFELITGRRGELSAENPKPVA